MTELSSQAAAEPSSRPGATALRTHLCGDLRASSVGDTVQIAGWLASSRDLGGFAFVTVRDRSGVIQVSLDPAKTPADAIAIALATPLESVVRVVGTCVARPAGMANPAMPTGDVEIHATAFSVLGPATNVPIPVDVKGANLPAEETRLRYRYMDLRRPALQSSLLMRHRVALRTRTYLDAQGYVEVETPILTKPTPEGARDYLVPSRVHRGEFFALPQSPQLYKQLLMVSGMDRYFQIARCFRDEDLRADRQPEFTQIDIEASFIDQSDIQRLTEGLLVAIFAEAGISITAPFARMSYRDAMEQYGCDRPDVRFDCRIRDYTDAFRGSEFAIARSAIEAGGRVRGLRIPGGAPLSRKQVDEIEAVAKSAGAAGLLRVKRTADSVDGAPAKALGERAAELLAMDEGDLLLMVAANDRISSPALDRVRQDAAERMSLRDASRHELLWVTDFPMFEADDSGALGAVHHPFTAPHPDDAALLDTNPAAARALAYDVVYNGTELGGGSIRIHDPALQRRVLGLLGIDEATATARFGFLLEALASGAPPHGGIALGLDRIAMFLAGAGSLRDVIAFPKTTAARALFEGAPTTVPAADLAALHISPMSE